MPRSSVPGLAWPGLPGTAGVTMPAPQYQLEQSQWWPPDVVRQHQFRQLQALPSHACGTVPFYRDRPGEAGFAPDRRLTADTWTRIPVLGRAEIQAAETALFSARVPPGRDRGHPGGGEGAERGTGGSSARGPEQAPRPSLRLPFHLRGRNPALGKPQIRGFPGRTGVPTPCQNRCWPPVTQISVPVM